MPKGGNNNGGNGNGGKGPKPPKITDQTFSTPETPADGTSLGTVVADVKPSKSTWSILSGNDDAAFAIDPLTGELSVADGSAVDYETEQTRNLVVQVVGNGKKAYSATVTINVSDVNEAPSAGPDVAVSVAETVDETTILASVAATDPDTLAANGNIEVIGSVGVTLEDDVTAFFGEILVDGSLGIVLEDDTMTGTLTIGFFENIVDIRGQVRTIITINGRVVTAAELRGEVVTKIDLDAVS